MAPYIPERSCRMVFISLAKPSTSRAVTMPTVRQSSSTTMRRISCRIIRSAASPTVPFVPMLTTGDDITAETEISAGSPPAATTLRVRSCSVMTPLSILPSMTRQLPVRRSVIRAAAVAMVASDGTVTRSEVMTVVILTHEAILIGWGWSSDDMAGFARM